MNGTFIPRYLDSLPQIFWWEIDELAVLFVCIFLGIVTKFLTYLIVVGIVSTLILSKMKNGKSDGFLFHWAYWSGVPTFQLTGAPHGTTREMME